MSGLESKLSPRVETSTTNEGLRGDPRPLSRKYFTAEQVPTRCYVLVDTEYWILT